MVLTILMFFTVSMLFSVDTMLNKKVTLDTDDGSLSAVLTTLAKMSNTNIVLAIEQKTNTSTTETQERKVTVHLKDVQIETAVALVAKSAGLSYRVMGDNTFIVGDKAKINEEVGERTYIVNVNNGSAADMVKAFQVMMPGKMVAIPGQNALMIKANPETFAEVMKRITELDVKIKQIEIRARLIEISVTSSKKYGVDWSKLSQLTTILAEDPSNGDGTGLPYSYTDVTGALPHGDPVDLYTLPDQQYFQKIDGWDGVGHFSRQLNAFDVTIDWLLENNAAKLLTDTRLTAKSGEEAEILIGEVVPFVVKNTDNEIQVQNVEAGIKLKVNPVVTRDGQITTTISPEVSSITELVSGYIPRTKTRRVTSTITVPDGKRIIVGGLLNSTLRQKTNKLPFLGDLPFIGKLFQHKEDILENYDLIIEITPRLIDMSKDQEEVKVDERLSKHLIDYEN